MSKKLLYKQTELPTKPNVAQKRWRLLARALVHSSVEEDEEDDEEVRQHRPEDEEVSVRRFGTFELIHRVPVHLQLEREATGSWWLYSLLIDSVYCEILISHVAKCFSANELIGFNNTGNVCVWPSEECLAYYLLKNPEICRGRKMLELGGGMSCLAGVLATKYCGPSSVRLTDGNAKSVENIRRIIEKNGLTDLARCSVVQWARAAKVLRQTTSYNGNRLLQEHSIINGDEAKYDVILCADCLFFDESRFDLVDTINGWLAEDGLALIMAPRRGTTFQKFMEAAIQKGLQARQNEHYEPEVWARHLEFLRTNRSYCPDLHFPVLLELTKLHSVGSLLSSD